MPQIRKLFLPVHVLFLTLLLGHSGSVAGHVEFQDDRMVAKICSPGGNLCVIVEFSVNVGPSSNFSGKQALRLRPSCRTNGRLGPTQRSPAGGGKDASVDRQFEVSQCLSESLLLVSAPYNHWTSFCRDQPWPLRIYRPRYGFHPFVVWDTRQSGPKHPGTTYGIGHVPPLPRGMIMW